MFDIEQLVADCRAALAERQAPSAVKEVVGRAVSTPGVLAESVSDAPAGLNVLYRAADLTVVNVVWPPQVSLSPHDHRMWAVIGIYGGVEDNSFYRRQGSSIAASGGKSLHEGDVLVLGTDAIHAVHNPCPRHTGAIHVYGGDFVSSSRSQWDEETLEEQPFDFDTARREIQRAQHIFEAGHR
jgi:predicted metal-dependent enzyme (double-stranded beta helix superfamily)